MSTSVDLKAKVEELNNILFAVNSLMDNVIAIVQNPDLQLEEVLTALNISLDTANSIKQKAISVTGES